MKEGMSPKTANSIYRITTRRFSSSAEQVVKEVYNLDKAFRVFDGAVKESPYEVTMYRITTYRTPYGVPDSILGTHERTELILRQKYDYMTGNDRAFLERAKKRYGKKYTYMAEEEVISFAAELETGETFTQEELIEWVNKIKDNEGVSIQPSGWEENDWLQVNQVVSEKGHKLDSDWDTPWDEEIEYRFDWIPDEADEEDGCWIVGYIQQPYDVVMSYPYYQNYRVSANSPEDAADEAFQGTGYRWGRGDIEMTPISSYGNISFDPDPPDSPVYGKYTAESVSTNHKELKLSKGTDFTLIAGVTFALFFTEAMIHYNMGEAKGGFINWDIPSKSELLKIAGVVAVFSILSGLAVGWIEHHITTRK